MLVSVGISDWIKENLKERFKDNSFQVLKEDQVGPKVGSELKRDAVLAVLLSLVVILIYLAFRFKFIFALGAVLALFHDVLITLGLYSILYGVIPGLNLEIDLAIVAAFLTLVGYSINDTVIVFDRVRENLKIHKTMPLFDLLNMSINRTMSRTILTGGTTLLAVLVIFIFGGEVLRAFAFTLAFGIIIGTYSSIFVASALVLELIRNFMKHFLVMPDLIRHLFFKCGNFYQGTATKTKLVDFSEAISNFDRIEGRKTESPFANLFDIFLPLSEDNNFRFPSSTNRILGPIWFSNFNSFLVEEKICISNSFAFVL